jgi:hypothetical protein
MPAVRYLKQRQAITSVRDARGREALERSKHESLAKYS